MNIDYTHISGLLVCEDEAANYCVYQRIIIDSTDESDSGFYQLEFVV